MPSTKNEQQLAELKAALKNSKAVILADYSGMPVNKQTALRKAIKEAGGTFTVAKNTLLKLAITENNTKELSEEAQKAFEGPTAILLTPIDDPVSPAKALVNFIKENELPVLKIGFMDGQVLSVEEVTNLSQLPDREQLLGMLVGQLNAPISGFAQVLRANLQNLVYALSAIKDQKAE